MAKAERLDSGDIVLTMSQSEAISNVSAIITLRDDTHFHFVSPSANANRDSIVEALKKAITDNG
jgi:hypothetical protein